MSLTDLPGFPDPATVPVVTVGRQQFYRTPYGDLPRVTTILKVLGLGTEGLIRWSATVEREAVLESCAEVYAEGVDGGPQEFRDAVEARIGHAKQHQVQLKKAGEIGTAAHDEIQRQSRIMLGLPVGPEPQLPEPALWAVMAWQDWMKQSRIRPHACEQPVYDAELGYGGKLDMVGYDPEGRLGLIDYKTSKGIYDDHHLQVMAYLKAGRNFVPIEWAKLVRIPKSVDDPQFEVVELGQMYGRTLTEEQLMSAFRGAVMAWKALKGNQAAGH